MRTLFTIREDRLFSLQQIDWMGIKNGFERYINELINFFGEKSIS